MWAKTVETPPYPEKKSNGLVNTDLGSLLIKFIFVGLWVAFMYLASIALMKYYSEPLATEITTSVGDDGVDIAYPDITICDTDYGEFL